MLFWIYIVIGSFWAQYALQKVNAYGESETKAVIKCILWNFLAWPIAMTRAYFDK
jgi:hypothetical protein